MNDTSRKAVGLFLLVMTALIWGGSFVAQKLGMDYIGPFAFTFFTDLLAGIFLSILVIFQGLKKGWATLFTRTNVLGGIASGAALWVGMALQQIGIQWTSPGVSAFLTANYVVVVPVMGLFTKRRPRGIVWVGVALAIIGSWFLCDPTSAAATANSNVKFPLGEILCVLCAFAFGTQICIVERFMTKPDSDALALTCLSFFVGALFSIPFLKLPTEQSLLTGENILAAAGAIAFCGFLSSGIACTLQNIGQRMIAPSVAALILSQESVFATIFGIFFLGSTLTASQILGCVLVFAAVLATHKGE
jgi:drug/metabolite transporter (DMT)-like permease